MSYTLNDFEYKFKFGKLKAVVCKHCGKKVSYELAKGKPLSDVIIHAAHSCVAHSFETPPVSNVGMYFSKFETKVVSVPTIKAKSRLIALKSLLERVLKHKL
jgi:hypothetical protein